MTADAALPDMTTCSAPSEKPATMRITARLEPSITACRRCGAEAMLSPLGSYACCSCGWRFFLTMSDPPDAVHAGWDIVLPGTTCSRCGIDSCWTTERLRLVGRDDFHYACCRGCRAWHPEHAATYEAVCRALDAAIRPLPQPVEPCERCGAACKTSSSDPAEIKCASCGLIEGHGYFRIEDAAKCERDWPSCGWHLVTRIHKGKRRFFRYCWNCASVCAKDAAMLASQDVPAHVYLGGRCAHCQRTFLPGKGHACPGTQHSCCEQCATEPCPTSVSSKQPKPKLAAPVRTLTRDERRDEDKELSAELQQSLKEVDQQRQALAREKEQARQELERLREQARSAQIDASLARYDAELKAKDAEHQARALAERQAREAREVAELRHRAEESILQAQRLASQTIRVEAERRQAMELRLKELESQHQQAAQTAQAQKQQTDESGECVICMDATRDTVLLECGHLATCHACAATLVGKTCPICRAPVKSVSRVFVP
jgi:Zinc finger, C3HC4 type (RING finger)